MSLAREEPRPHLAGCLAATAAVLLVIAMGEINRLSAAVLDDKGRAWPFSQLMGPSRLVDHSADGWTAGTGTFSGGLSTWLSWYLALDLVFVLVYTATLLTLFIDRYRPAALLAVVLGAVDLTEDILAFVAGRPAAAQPEPGLLQRALPWVSGAKWLFAVLLVVGLVRRFGSRTEPDWRQAFGRLVRALFTQRFSVLPLLPILVLSVVPGANMLDQLPDIQRRWADGGLGVAHGLAATVSLLVLAAVLFVMGRLRTDFAWRRVYGWGDRSAIRPGHAAEDVEVGRPEPTVWIWLVAPLVVLLTALLLPAITHTVGLSAVRLALFAGIPFAVGLVSLAFKYVLARPARGAVTRAIHGSVRRPAKRVLEPAHLRPIQLTGDVLATLALVVGGLGLVRSFTSLVVLHPENPRAWALLVAGALSALLVWPLAQVVAQLPLGSLPAGPGRMAALLVPGRANPTNRYAVSMRITLMTVCALGYLAVGSFPLVMAHWAGVIASVVLALTFMTAMVGSMVVLLQYGGSPHAFWVPGLRLSAAPVASLLIAVLVGASAVGGDSDVHGVRGLTAGARASGAPASVQRVDLLKAFLAWLADPTACRVPIVVEGRRYTLRPLVMVAAEGGGIRAAYWTAASLELLSGASISGGGTPAWASPHTGDRAACGASSTLFSTGASGGAVGLAVTRYAAAVDGAAPETTAREQVAAIAAPDGLGAGALGLLVRDLVYSASGIPLPVLGSEDVASAHRRPDGRNPWVDRAGLMEYVWEHAAPALARHYLPDGQPGRTHVPSGHLVLGSTSMTTGCRMLVSQLDLSAQGEAQPGSETAGAPAPPPQQNDVPANGTCDALGRPAARSVDVLGDYDASRGPGEGCLGRLTAATASMLAARFPYVTPSGVIGPCGPWPIQQLVDGGYTENSGIGTVVDLAAQWLPLVEELNTAELRSSAQPVELVVPLVVYLDNGTGSDLSTPTRKLTSELLVPPVGNSRAGKAQSDAPALLQRAAAVAAVDRLWDRGVVQRPGLAEAITAWRPEPVVVINQSTFPAVTAPLGWVLSEDSIATMDRALRQQASVRCSLGDPQSALCAKGIGTLGDALAVLSPR